MIIDNADDPEVLMSGTDGDTMASRLVDYLPNNDSGKIVFTTRSRKAALYWTQGIVLELQGMNEAEARQLLAQRLVNQVLLDDVKAVDRLLESLCLIHLRSYKVLDLSTTMACQ
jgi:hypothetical protein